ncbi:class I SAM-dependent methyltransferase [Deinococcus planocerae]|uniref:class I SAM-dependent methyltransferase n=1 Tax=Deinococcus planocerae TaxID=1737569 RepID=UPI000C7EB64F|nr:class I SAM-dependent methyltransferase [Deinococcus planocerae]
MNNRPSTDLWGVAEAYEGYMGRWSRGIAPLFTAWLAPEPGRNWVDLGCGTGALSACVSHTCRPGSLLGLDTSEGFLAYAAGQVPGAAFRVGDAADTHLPSGGFDYAVSGLVLNFVPDPARALREMARLVRPGGRVALYVWDYAGQMQIMRHFFDAARPIDPGSVAFDDGVRAPVCRPGPLRAALTGAGLEDVEVTALDLPAAFDSFEAYWAPFLGGTGSAPKYCASLDPQVRERIRQAVRAALPTGPDGEILLAVRAWAAKGTVRP